MKLMVKSAFQSAGMQSAMMMLALLFIQMMVSDNLWIRIPVCILMMLAYLFVGFVSAMAKGERDCVLSERNAHARERGEAVSEQETQAEYQPMRGFLSALLGGIIVFAALLIIALVARAFLPLWKTTGLMFESVMNVYLVPYIGFLDWFRAASQSLLYVALAVFPLLFIIACGLGYMQGPRRRAKVREVIAGARERFEKKQRQEKREAKKKLAQERQKKG